MVFEVSNSENLAVAFPNIYSNETSTSYKHLVYELISACNTHELFYFLDLTLTGEK